MRNEGSDRAWATQLRLLGGITALSPGLREKIRGACDAKQGERLSAMRFRVLERMEWAKPGELCGVDHGGIASRCHEPDKRDKSVQPVGCMMLITKLTKKD